MQAGGGLLVQLCDLRAALLGLPIEQREAVFLVAVAGLGIRGAGRHLDIPSATLASRYYTGLGSVIDRMNGGQPE
jgi:DNA-directed RNA polymerase specialized sigma24 family protein